MFCLKKEGQDGSSLRKEKLKSLIIILLHKLLVWNFGSVISVLCMVF